jgi:hypothetical protein
MATFNRKTVKNWMTRNVEDFRDSYTDEINATEMAEAAAAHFGQDHVDGPLDNETHWIWDVALEVK